MKENNEVSNNIQLPSDIEAEKAVLSSMLFDEEGIYVASSILNKEDFYYVQHQIIFTAILELNFLEQPLDFIILKNKLESMERLEKVGGISYIIDLFNIVSTSAKVRYYCDIVKEKSLRRKLLVISQNIQKLSIDTTQEIDYVINKSEKMFEDLSKNENNESFQSIEKILISAIEHIEKVHLHKSKITGLETGFADFDMKTAGLQPSDFILIAARPSMGKTAFVLNIAQYVSIHKKVTTAIFSLEMSKEQLVNRIISSEVFLDSYKLKTGDMEVKDWEKLCEAVEVISKAPIFIDDSSSITINEIKARCRRLKKEKNLGLVIIDYLQLMTGSGKQESRQQEIANISRNLKILARDLNVPVIALSQLSRAVEQRKPPRPMLSDLRESGAIEQDADLVCFLYRDEYYNPETEKVGIAEVIIAKQRNGAVGSIELNWNPKYTKFTSIEKVYSNI